MALTLSLMLEDDIPAFAVMDAAALANWGLARAMDLTSPNGAPREQNVERWVREGFRNDSERVWLKVTDTATGELVPAAEWHFRLVAEPPTADGDIMSEPVAGGTGGEGDGGSTKGEWKRGIFAAMGRTLREFRDEFVGRQPYAYLATLVTHPEHQRRGAGGMLVRWGCERADEQGLMSHLTASEAGLRLYRQHGFVVVKEAPLDLRPFGVVETEIRRGMVREAKVKGK